ncbi:hypothetical protein MBGDF03_00048 [Thermoplasmatales archaeon SCGC AB-540-F20]|nr:hypothetical protein MBGDF03_00048 [Thermoplasmatales archaeon SCGC AB-540-F20]
MRKSKFRKGLVLGIIVLFVGASLVQYFFLIFNYKMKWCDEK